MSEVQGQSCGLNRRVVLAMGALLPLTGLAPSLAAHTPAAPMSSEGSLAVPGGTLGYWDTGGPGEPIIFVHPATGSKDSWKYQRGFFAAAGYRVVAYSRWGYPGSGPAPQDDRKDFQDLIAVMDALGLARAHLVGVAAGAAVVAPVVAQFPERVATASFFGSVTGIEDDLIQSVYRRLRGPNFHDQGPEFRELSPNYRAADPAGVEEWKAIERGRPDFSPDRRVQATLADLAASGVPLLLATGDADQYAPPYLMRLAARHLPNARYQTIEEAGHATFWEQPAAFNALVLAFLETAR